MQYVEVVMTWLVLLIRGDESLDLHAETPIGPSCFYGQFRDTRLDGVGQISSEISPHCFVTMGSLRNCELLVSIVEAVFFRFRKEWWKRMGSPDRCGCACAIEAGLSGNFLLTCFAETAEVNRSA